MKGLLYLPLLGLLLLSCNTNLAQDINPERQWSSYRGYYASGVLDKANLPDKWNVEKSENVKWKMEIPGMGLSSPVVWGDKLFITTAISEADTGAYKIGLYGSIGSVNDSSVHEWKIYCLNKNTGEKFL